MGQIDNERLQQIINNAVNKQVLLLRQQMQRQQAAVRQTQKPRLPKPHRRKPKKQEPPKPQAQPTNQFVYQLSATLYKAVIYPNVPTSVFLTINGDGNNCAISYNPYDGSFAVKYRGHSKQYYLFTKYDSDIVALSNDLYAFLIKERQNDKSPLQPQGKTDPNKPMFSVSKFVGN